MSTLLIPVSSCSIPERAKLYLADCVDRNWLSQGVYVERFERAFAERLGSQYATSCSSGTAALHLAMIAAGVTKDTDVIVPAMTYVATANAAHYCGARVWFCDVDHDTWVMTQSTVRETTDRFGLINPYIVPVHLYGSASCVDGSNVIVDSSHLMLSFSHNPLSICSAFSLYASKIIGCGEGGMIATDSEEINRICRLYRGQGMSKGLGSPFLHGNYWHDHIGHNYRMTDMQAAVGLSQLEVLDETLDLRSAVLDRYAKNLGNMRGVTTQAGRGSSKESSAGWIQGIALDHGIDRVKVSELLYADGIETRPLFTPLHHLPPYSGSDVFEICPVSSDLFERGLCLPTYPGLSLDLVDYICDKLDNAIERSGRDD